jgi:integrase/recombinase XerD
MDQFFGKVPTIQRLQQGPLSTYLNEFAAQLSSEGYGLVAARRQIQVTANFSAWLKKNRVSAQQITPGHVERFVKYLVRKRPLRSTDPAALKRMLAILRRQGVISNEDVVSLQPSSSELLQDEFVRYLFKERGLAKSSVFIYQTFVVFFLNDRFAGGDVLPSELSAADIVSFVRRQALSLQPKRAKLMMTAIRSFLRFLHYRGFVHVDLGAAIPKIISWSMAEIPRAMPVAQVALILAVCNRQNTRGRRDYAILLLLSRLGLRAGEVVSLTLDDIDWNASSITIHGKGSQISKLPLPTDVGEALADYLQKGRPQTTSRAMFFTVKAPIVALTKQQSVGHVVARSLARAGIDTPRKGAHQLRHTLATEMLRQGAWLEEIGEILRHQSPQSTMIYAKVDSASLRQLALSWPGGAL